MQIPGLPKRNIMVTAKSRVQLWHTSTCYSSNRIWFGRNVVFSNTNITRTKQKKRTTTNAILLYSLLFRAHLLACIDIDLSCQFISKNDEKSCIYVCIYECKKAM